jgi:arylsulfatase A-like enzyme
MTGRYPQRTGVSRILPAPRGTKGLLPDEVTVARLLKGAGYRTALFGKWHLGSVPESAPNAQGFDEFYGFHAGCIDYYSHIMYWEQPPTHDLWRDNTEVWENGTYFTDIITRESLRFIGQNRTRPFLLYVAYNAPHYPMHAPAANMKRFAHLDPHRQLQAAMVSTVDDSVGRIMTELRKLGLERDTVVFFQSDNGATIEKRSVLDGSGVFYHGGSNVPYRGFKGGLYEGGIHMPAFLSWPGHIPAGGVVDGIGCAVDVLPTFAAAARVERPSRVIDGRDVMPMAMGKAGSPHDALFWKYGDQVALRQGKWKLILQGKESFEEDNRLPEFFLADLVADPSESHNISSGHPDVLRRMSDIARQMERDVESRR